MSDRWLSIIGIGEDGLAGMGEASRNALDSAEVVIGGPRHLALANVEARGIPWPLPFSIAPVLDQSGRPTAVLASGDPFWFGVGTALADAVPPREWRAYPAPSTLALAAARLGWSQQGLRAFGCHAAPYEGLRPYLADGRRALVLLRDEAAPAELARWLTAAGFGTSALYLLEALGGPRERITHHRADTLEMAEIRIPVAAAVELQGPTEAALSTAAGREDAAFRHDGQITKAPVRALTLAALAPRAGERLWDLGAGSGSVSVEWCLAAPGAEAIAVEQSEDRAANIRANATAYGLAPRVSVHHGKSLDALAELPDPAAVFVGGGADAALFDRLWRRVAPGTRVVTNAVTLETQALVAERHAGLGGRLLKIDLAEAAPLGPGRGWTASRTLVQWSVIR
ncbi:MAG: precorrin-6y C5,15-methyltransferase (decarboxylating) subunit CbiE [Pseudomonadota bacterium]